MYGIRDMNRERLIARAKSRCALAEKPERFRLNIRACGFTYAPKLVMSL
jgi:hypothetical protein